MGSPRTPADSNHTLSARSERLSGLADTEEVTGSNPVRRRAISDDLQDQANELADAFHDADTYELDRLVPEQRAEQERARWALHKYVDDVWEAEKRRVGEYGINLDECPGWLIWAGMRDLTYALWTNAQDGSPEG